jgi:hypothetical protein
VKATNQRIKPGQGLQNAWYGFQWMRFGELVGGTTARKLPKIIIPRQAGGVNIAEQQQPGFMGLTDKENVI